MRSPITQAGAGTQRRVGNTLDETILCSRCGGLKVTVIDGQRILPKDWKKALDLGMAVDVWCIC